MPKPRLTPLATCLALVACGGGGGGSNDATDGADGVSPPPALAASDPDLAGEVLVRLAATADLSGVLATHGLSRLDAFGSRPIYRLAVPSGTALAPLLDALRADPRVLRAEPNRSAGTPEGRRRSVWAIGEASAYAAQWAPQALQLPTAHTIATGIGVRVAILDTGVDTAHPALAGRLLPGRDFVDDDLDPSEAGGPADAGYGHGTHVAGLVALAAPGASLMPLRVLDAQGRGNVWVIGEALLHAVDPDGLPSTPDGARVINLSLGTTEPTELLRDLIDILDCDDDDDDDDDDQDEDAVRCAAQGGTVVIAAAGNDASETRRQYPAAEGAPGSLSVGASTAETALADFSNRGPWVQITAPGEGLTSSVPGGGWGVWSGTSMSAPLVAGAAAVLREAQPDLTAIELAQRLTARAGRLCDDTLPRLDLLAALQDSSPAEPVCN